MSNQNQEPSTSCIISNKSTVAYFVSGGGGIVREQIYILEDGLNSGSQTQVIVKEVRP